MGCLICKDIFLSRLCLLYGTPPRSQSKYLQIYTLYEKRLIYIDEPQATISFIDLRLLLKIGLLVVDRAYVPNCTS